MTWRFASPENSDDSNASCPATPDHHLRSGYRATTCLRPPQAWGTRTHHYRCARAWQARRPRCTMACKREHPHLGNLQFAHPQCHPDNAGGELLQKSRPGGVCQRSRGAPCRQVLIVMTQADPWNHCLSGWPALATTCRHYVSPDSHTTSALPPDSSSRAHQALTHRTRE